MQYIDNVQEKIKLQEGKGIIEKILIYVYIEEHLSTKELAKKVFLPNPDVTAVIRELTVLDIVVQKNGVRLTDKGKKYVEEQLGYKGLNIDKLLKLKTDNEYQDELVKKLSEIYGEIYAKRPLVDLLIDQEKVTIEAVFRRAILALTNDCLINKKLLCIGDDDLVSLGIGLLLKELYSYTQNICSEIVVLDINERIVNYINLIATEQKIPVRAIQADFREPLPITYANYFDSFFMEPPYTEEGLMLFLSRGISALKKEKGLKVFLSFGQKPINETLDIQTIILKHGLIINSIMKWYNEYEGTRMPGNMSQMFVLESTDRMRNVVSMKETCSIQNLKKLSYSFCGCDSFAFLKDKKKLIGKNENFSLGKHILADFYDCKHEILCDEKLIQKLMHNAAIVANATIVQESFHKFSPWGVSGAVIIKESHLTIHTWPEYNYAAVDIFTCGKSLELWKALEYLKEHLQCENMQYNDIMRGNFSFRY